MKRLLSSQHCMSLPEGSLQSLDWTGLDSDDVIDNVLLHLCAGFVI